MPPRPGPQVKVAPRLPPLPRLRIRSTSKDQLAHPCTGVMSALLGCWASSGQTSGSCRALEANLRACMDAKRPPAKKTDNINHHLGRMFPRLVMQAKKPKPTKTG